MTNSTPYIPNDLIVKHIFPKLSYNDLINNKLVFKNMIVDIDNCINDKRVKVYNNIIDTMTSEFVLHLTNLFEILNEQLSPSNKFIHAFISTFKIGNHQIYIGLHRYNIGIHPANKIIFTVFKDIENFNSWHLVKEYHPEDLIDYFHIGFNEYSREKWIQKITPNVKKMFMNEIKELSPSNTLKETIETLKTYIQNQHYQSNIEFSFKTQCDSLYSATYKIGNTYIFHIPQNNWNKWKYIRDKVWKNKYLIPFQAKCESVILGFRNCIINTPIDFTTI